MTDHAPRKSPRADIKRIADALDRAFPLPAPSLSLGHTPAYRLGDDGLQPVRAFSPLPLDLIVGIDRQKNELTENLRRHASGSASHDMLLWGVRGAGKSALVKSATGQLQAEGLPLILIEVASHHIERLPSLWGQLAADERRICLYVDDIGYDGSDGEARRIRSMLDGGVEERPANVRLAVTTNQRNIVKRTEADQPRAINDRDDAEDSLALADRFGLKLGFQRPNQDAYLAMVEAYAGHFGLAWDRQQALDFAHQRGGQSGRTAWHFAVEMAGAAGKSLDF